MGTAPTQLQSILGVLLRAIDNHILILIQLLLRGGSTQIIDSPHQEVLESGSPQFFMETSFRAFERDGSFRRTRLFLSAQGSSLGVSAREGLDPEAEF